MNGKRITFLLLASLSLTGLCKGAVFQRDWKTSSDGLLTYDDVNQREWLDLSQTLLSSQFPGADHEAKYQYVAGQTGSGGIFQGFTIAKSQDTIALAQSAGINTAFLDYNINHQPTRVLEKLLGITFGDPNVNTSNTAAIGMLDEIIPVFLRRRAAFFEVFYASQTAGLYLASPEEYIPPPPGVMLYRLTVPEPDSILLAMVGLVVVTWRRRQRRK